eukprot:11986826-Prorocentrum_lima.AAC.1
MTTRTTLQRMLNLSEHNSKGTEGGPAFSLGGTKERSAGGTVERAWKGHLGDGRREGRPVQSPYQ